MKEIQNQVRHVGHLVCLLREISRAEEHTKETVMSTNRPLQVRDILLAPGQYVFRLTKPDVDHSVVSIYNSQTNRLERTIIGLPAYRLTADDKHGFTVSQLQAGRRAKLQTWFYPGENFGWSFGGR
jgi:hypothetical protein